MLGNNLPRTSLQGISEDELRHYLPGAFGKQVDTCLQVASGGVSGSKAEVAGRSAQTPQKAGGALLNFVHWATRRRRWSPSRARRRSASCQRSRARRRSEPRRSRHSRSRYGDGLAGCGWPLHDVQAAVTSCCWAPRHAVVCTQALSCCTAIPPEHPCRFTLSYLFHSTSPQPQSSLHHCPQCCPASPKAPSARDHSQP